MEDGGFAATDVTLNGYKFLICHGCGGFQMNIIKRRRNRNKE